MIYSKRSKPLTISDEIINMLTHHNHVYCNDLQIVIRLPFNINFKTNKTKKKKKKQKFNFFQIALGVFR